MNNPSGWATYGELGSGIQQLNEKSEIRKRLFNNITIECMELASYCDCEITYDACII